MKISSSSCLEILKRNLIVRKSSSNALRLQPYTPPYLNLTQSQSQKNLTLKNSFTHSRCSRYHKTNHYFSLQYSFCAVCIHSNKAQNNGKREMKHRSITGKRPGCWAGFSIAAFVVGFFHTTEYSFRKVTLLFWVSKRVRFYFFLFTFSSRILRLLNHTSSLQSKYRGNIYSVTTSASFEIASRIDRNEVF